MSKAENKEMIDPQTDSFIIFKQKVQKLYDAGIVLSGRWGNYVIQSSHGGLQVKKYEPHKYKNHNNTPLRRRCRDIIKIAAKHSFPSRQDVLLHLYKTYPYYLSVCRPLFLNIRNFYFDSKPKNDNSIKIYRKKNKDDYYTCVNDPIAEVKYSLNRKVEFQYRGVREEFYYAVNESNQEMSNVLHFVWL